MDPRAALSLLVLLLTYLGLALGGLPGYRMNRAGVALVGASFLLLLGTLDLGAAWEALDAPTLAFLFGVMVLNAQLSYAGFFALAAQGLLPLAQSPLGLLLSATLLSLLISNVPAVLLLAHHVEGEASWLLLAGGSTLAGNLTLLAGVANLIVAEGAGKEGVRISFAEHLRFGLPLTLLTLAFLYLWLT